MDFIHTLQSLFMEIGKFLIFSVGVGYILRKWVGDQIIKFGKWWAAKNERNTAIWLHYQHQALYEGHQSESVLDCHQDKCRVFTTYAS